MEALEDDALLRHVCITDSKAEAADFIDNARHQIRLSQSLRHREELIDGTMLVEKPYKAEPPIEELASHIPVGDAETVAERLTELIRAARPRHMLLHFHAGASSQRTALRSIERVRHARAAADRAGARAAGSVGDREGGVAA